MTKSLFKVNLVLDKTVDGNRYPMDRLYFILAEDADEALQLLAMEVMTKITNRGIQNVLQRMEIVKLNDKQVLQ